jgi:hypothetical protein
MYVVIIDRSPITYDSLTDYRQADALDLPSLTETLRGS